MTPRVSVVVAWVTHPEPLRRTVESLLRQDEQSWELLVVRPEVSGDDVPTEGTPHRPGRGHRSDPLHDPRVRDVRVDAVDTGDAGPALEAGRRAARGEHVGVLAAGDELEPGALAAALTVLDADPSLDVVYTDEQWPGRGAEGIATKPDWTRRYLQSYPYLGRLCLVRRSLLDDAGGFRAGYEGAEEWDAHLRVTERTSRIGHAPVVGVSRPAAPRVDEVTEAAGRAAVAGAVERSGRAGRVEPAPYPGGVRLWWSVDPAPLVSIVMPTAGGRREVRGEDSLLVARAVRSIVELTTYDAWELVLVTSAHTPPDVVPTIEALVGDRLRVAPVDGAFNFSYSVNEGALAARGELLLLLNDDTEVIEPRWLEHLVSMAQDPQVGVVGAKLLFEDETVQHVGVIFDEHMLPVHALGSEVHDAGRFGTKVLDLDLLAVTGACLLTPASVFAEVGGFCEDLPLNYNDVDYCLKVVASGRDVVTSGFAELYHYESSTRGHASDASESDFLERHWGVRRRLDPHVQYRTTL